MKKTISLTPAKSLSGSGGGATVSLALMMGMMFSDINSWRVLCRLVQVNSFSKSGFVTNTLTNMTSVREL